MVRRVASAVLLVSFVLAACTPRPWERDPDVQAAKDACGNLPEGERYTCIERYAIEALNPDICRLTGKWIDDMCLQSIYQAASDPAICDRLYLRGVRLTCDDYYRRPPVDFVTDTILSVGGEMGRYVVEYQVAITHWGNHAVEDLEAHLVFPEAAGLPVHVALEETLTAPADLVKPNRGLIYEGEILWDTERSTEEISTLIDGAQVRLAWTFEGERAEALFPLSTEKGPDVFPTSES